MLEFGISLFVVAGAVVAYAMGYFKERSQVEPPPKPDQMSADPVEAHKALYEAYGLEYAARYERNHCRRKAEKLLKEFMLATLHLLMFAGMAIACVKIPYFEPGLIAALLVVGLTYLTTALKAGQLTASKQDVENREAILSHAIDHVNEARLNFMNTNPKDAWSTALTSTERGHYDY